VNADPCDSKLSLVFSEFGLQPPRRLVTLGGTASHTYLAEGEFGRIVIRIRSPEFSSEELVQFDHQCLKRLADAGLPVPSPLEAPSGATWIHCEGQIVELMTWITGDPFQEGDQRAIANVGESLAQFHRALAVDIPQGKEGFIREDHPDLLKEYLLQLQPLCQTDDEVEQVAAVGAQLDIIRGGLDDSLYAQLPRAVIHGDIHPGNIRFQGSKVSAIYDFDYMSEQARARDICDALMFFPASRDGPLNTNDIWSLTQPFQLIRSQCRVLIRAYDGISPLNDLDWLGLPLLMRSQWCQIRLRGSRKVPSAQKVTFVLRRFTEMIDWFDQHADSFFTQVRHDVA